MTDKGPVMLEDDSPDLNELLRDNPAGISSYLTENFGENDPGRARAALYVVFVAQNVQMLARDAGLRRDALYKTFGGRIDPQLSRVLKLLAAMNVVPRVAPAPGGSEAIAARLTEAFGREDPAEAILGLSEVVKSQNVSALALKLGVMRTTVYKTFGGTVDPQLKRVLNLFGALQVRLAVEPATPPKIRPNRPKRGRPPKVQAP
ncbi:transcriptional regulator [Bradyrhizobium sp. IC3123]|uniref:helix-turn-helix domain-containing transcriptional regulator n=1 Tax=Bradyrhizobium sp. IC3123 TaxID=2793803 RepID=UPI001CD46910